MTVVPAATVPSGWVMVNVAVVGLDGPAFADVWLTAVEVADRRP